MATIMKSERTFTLSAEEAEPLDGSAAGRTYQGKDRPADYSFTLNEETDAVTIMMDGTGSDGDSAVFNILGYGLGVLDNRNPSPAERIYHAVTATLGAAVAGTGKYFAEHFTGTSTHVKTVGITDSALAGNSVAKIAFDTTGLRFLVFEPITFNTLTAITFHIREWGTK